MPKARNARKITSENLDRESFTPRWTAAAAKDQVQLDIFSSASVPTLAESASTKRRRCDKQTASAEIANTRYTKQCRS